MWKRLSVLWVALKGDARLLWFALRHPQAPLWLKGGTALVLLYLFSPIDLVPDVLPFFGVIDDVVLVPLAVRFMLGRLPAAVRDDAERQAAGGSAAVR